MTTQRKVESLVETLKDAAAKPIPVDEENLPPPATAEQRNTPMSQHMARYASQIAVPK